MFASGLHQSGNQIKEMGSRIGQYVRYRQLDQKAKSGNKKHQKGTENKIANFLSKNTEIVIR